MERRHLPVALLAAAAGAAVIRPESALAQTVTHGTLLGPPLLFTGGSAVYTPSAGATSIYVVLIGGGGGSGGAEFTSVGSASGGGGAGSICAKYVNPIGTSYQIIGGAGGYAGSSGANSGGGGRSTSFYPIDGPQLATLIAPGGNGSPGAADGTLIARGAPVTQTASNGDLNLGQRSGSPGFAISGSFLSGAGGNNAYGAGGGSINTQGPGSVGTGYGAGGGGAVATTASQAGAHGAVGAVIVWEYS